MNEKVKRTSEKIGAYTEERLKNGKMVFKKQIKLNGSVTTVTGKTYEELVEKVGLRKRESQEVKVANSKSITFAEISGLWLASYSKTVKKGTADWNRGLLNNWILPKLGDVSLQLIDSASLETLTNHWAKEECEATADGIRHNLRLIKKIINFAAVQGYAIEPGVLLSPLPEKVKTAVNYLDENEVAAFVKNLSAIKPNQRKDNGSIYRTGLLKTYLRLLLLTGLQGVEMLGLRWHAFEKESKNLSVETIFRKDKLIPLEQKDPAKRKVFIDAYSVSLLEAWREKQAKLLQAKGIGMPEFIFQSYELMAPLSHHGLWVGTKSMFSEAGFPRLLLNDLRHTHVYLLANSDVPPYEAMTRLGLANLRIFMETYGHFFKPEEFAIAKALKEMSALMGAVR